MTVNKKKYLLKKFGKRIKKEIKNNQFKKHKEKDETKGEILNKTMMPKETKKSKH